MTSGEVESPLGPPVDWTTAAAIAVHALIFGPTLYF